jgi:hypothetical protein
MRSTFSKRRRSYAIFVILMTWIGLGSTIPSAASGPSRHALIIIGLPGTPSHDELHQRTARTWTRWLQTIAEVPEQQLLTCSNRSSDAEPAAQSYGNDRAGIQEAIQHLATRVEPDDAIWIMMLGHGSYDGRDAVLHLPGPDLTAREYATMFATLPVSRQVVLCTMACSGHFLEHLSRPGRIVVTATTADAEPNETEFPQALASVMEQCEQPAASELDRDGDQDLSALEILIAADTAVAQRYASDGRARTEHALLDDDGDGQGSELASLQPLLAPSSIAHNATPTDADQASVAPQKDGRVAAQWRLHRWNSPATADVPEEGDTNTNTNTNTNTGDARDGL